MEAEILKQKARDENPVIINNISDAVDLCQDMADLAQETFQVISMGPGNAVIGRHLISLGTVDSVDCVPREVFRAAITDGATFIILLHNHPSGEVQPTKDDILTTKALLAAADIIGITIVDHAIITTNGCFSLRESGLVAF